MKRSRYIVVAAAILVACDCLSPLSSQPTPVSPPEIACKHFLYGYPLGSPSCHV